MNRLAAFCFLILSMHCKAQRVFNVMDYGAKGDGITDDAKPIQKAIDACAEAHGGRVLIPTGYVFVAGPFTLRSNIEFHVSNGAVVVANPDESVYNKSAFRNNPGEGMKWIDAEKVNNLSITGLGEINGNGISFMGKELQDSYELKPFNIKDPRPHVLTITEGRNIRIHDVHIGNSAYWTVHLIGCNDVVISGITLLNSLKVRNSDGIDVDHSKNVRVSNCYIESGDDCICLKNRREFDEYGRCENITVTNCTMTSRSCAIKIGSENVDTIQHVVISNCIITKSNRGIGIQNRDEGVVQNVVFSDIIIDSHFFSDVWWGKAEPIYVTAFKRASGNHKDANWRFPKGATEGKVGIVRNIYFNNINCTSENGVFVSGESPDKIDGIYFNNVNLTVSKTTAIAGGVYDRRPCAVQGFVHGNTSGFFLDVANAVSIKNSSVKWGIPVNYFGHAIQSQNVASLDIQNFSGQSAFPAKLRAIKK